MSRLLHRPKSTLPLLLALPWIPVAREYNSMRRVLFAAA